MKDSTRKIILLANKARSAIAGNRIARRTVSAFVALSLVLSPLTPELAVYAAENANLDETIEEQASEQSEPDETEAILPTESLVPDFSDYAVDEPVIVENDEDIDVTDPSDSIDSTAPPTEQTEETSAETTEPSSSETTEVTETTQPEQPKQQWLNSLLRKQRAT